MIKVSTVANNPWLVVVACLSGFWWFIENKPLIPDELEPVVVSEMHARVIPLEEGDKRDAKNWAVRNISFYSDELCECMLNPCPSGVTDLYHSERQDEYATFEWATGAKHRYETMGQHDICNERNK